MPNRVQFGSTRRVFAIAITLLCWLGSKPALAQTCPTSAPIITNVADSPAGCTVTRVTWDGVPNASYYEVYKSLDGSSNWQLVNFVTAQTLYLDIDSYTLPQSGWIYFRVDATKSGCTSISSAPMSHLTEALPIRPSNVTAVPINSTQVRVNWKQESAPNVYALIFRDNETTPLATVNYYDATVVVPGTCGTHDYKVQAQVSSTCFSPKIAASPAATMPASAPSSLSPADGVVMNAAAVTFTWTTSICVSAYELWISSTSNFDSPTTVTTGATSHTVSNLAEGFFYWKVRAKNNIGQWSAFSNTRTFTRIPLELVSPVGTEDWPPGSTQQIQWTGGAPDTIFLYTDPVVQGSRLGGPYHVLATNPGSSPATVTIPADIATTRARVQIGRAVGGGKAFSYSPNKFRIVTAPAPGTWSYVPVGPPNQASASSDMVSNGVAGVDFVFQDATLGRLKGASVADKTANFTTTFIGFDDYGGIAPRCARGADGKLHAVYFSWGFISSVLYAVRTNGAWVADQWVTDIGNTANFEASITVDNNNLPVIAYNTGNIPVAGNQLRVRRKTAQGTWATMGSFPSSIHPEKITLRAAPNGYFYVSFIDHPSPLTSRGNFYIYNPANGTWVVWPTVSLPAGSYADISFDMYPGVNGTPRLAYALANPQGGHTLYYQGVDENGLYGAPVLVDDSPMSIPSLDLTLGSNDFKTTIGYVANGVVRMARWESFTQFTRSIVDASGDMDARVSVAVDDVDSDRWLLYYDRTTQALRCAKPYFVDVTPPAPSPFLSATGYCVDIKVGWQSTGDDGTTGLASYYDLRWSTSPITNQTQFMAAQAVPDIPAVVPNGTYVEKVINLGNCSAHYYFAVRIVDESGNASAITYGADAQTACPNPWADCYDELQADSENLSSPLPQKLEFRLLGANPTRSATAFELAIPSADRGKPVEMSIFDVTGRRVTTMWKAAAVPGIHKVDWDLRDAQGARVQKGLYFGRVRVGGTEFRKRIVLVD